MRNSTIKYCPHCGNPMVKEGICESCATQDGWVDKGKNPHGIKRGCFPAGTKIFTPSGNLPIETFAEGSSVLCWCRNTHKLIEGQVLALKIHECSIITRLSLSNGAELKTTEAHSILTPQGWRKVSQVETGDTVLTVFGAQYVTHIHESVRSEPVFNLVTWPENNFIADGAIAHNFTYFKGLKKLFWNLLKCIRDWIACAKALNLNVIHGYSGGSK